MVERFTSLLRLQKRSTIYQFKPYHLYQKQGHPKGSIADSWIHPKYITYWIVTMPSSHPIIGVVPTNSHWFPSQNDRL